MEGKATKAQDAVDLVRISKKVVEMVRKHKEKTGVNIGKFFEMAAIEKLKSQKSSK